MVFLAIDFWAYIAPEFYYFTMETKENAPTPIDLTL